MEGAAKSPVTYVSPSGKYRLIVEEVPTKPGCWNYTHGRVEHVALNQWGKVSGLVVRRNYSAFPFGWMEGHPDSHDYLLCGSDYQGQTVVRLDTLERWDYREGYAAEGNGWCIGEYESTANPSCVAIVGCVWGGPYDRRFYDLTNPTVFPWPLIREEPADDSGDDDDDDDEGCVQGATNGR